MTHPEREISSRRVNGGAPIAGCCCFLAHSVCSTKDICPSRSAPAEPPADGVVPLWGPRPHYGECGLDATNAWLAEDPEEREVLAARQPLTQVEMCSLVHDRSPYVRAALASRSDLPPAITELLACDPCEDVRAALLRGASHIAPTLQRVLARDGAWAVRAALAGRSGVVSMVRQRLAGDRVAEVRAAVEEAAHPVPHGTTEMRHVMLAVRRAVVMRGTQ